MSLTAGDIVFNIKGDDTQLGDALTRAKQSFAGAGMAIGAAMTVAGAAITGMAAAAISDFTETGSAVNDMALRTGFGTTALQELGYAAGLSGGSMDDVEKAAKKMSQTIFQAGQEAEDAGTKQKQAWAKGSTEVITATGTYTNALAALGLSYGQLKELKPEDQFMAVGFALADVSNATDRAALAQQVFGRAGTSLLPMLSEGRAGFQAMADEAHRLGIILDEKGIAAADKFGDSLDKLKGSLRGLGFSIAESLVPALQKIVDSITPVMATMNEWRNQNPGLFDSLTKIAVVVGAVMFVLGPLIVMLPKIVAAFALVKTAVIAVGAVFSALGLAVSLPVDIVILAIANIIAWGYLLVKNWDKVKEFMIGIWKVMANAFELIMSPIMWAWEKMKGVGLDNARAAMDSQAPQGNFDTAPGSSQARGLISGGMAMAGAGGGGAAITMNFNISGATDPGSISRTIAEQLRLELRARGI